MREALRIPSPTLPTRNGQLHGRVVERVALVEFFGIGGTADYTDCLASALASRGIETAVVTSTLFQPLNARPDYRIVRPFAYQPQQPKPWKAFQLARAMPAARRFLQDFKPDIVHAQGTVLPLIERRLYAPLRVTTVCTVHDARAHERRPLLGSFSRFYRDFDLLICHSQFTRHALQSALPEARIEVVPHGLYQPLTGPMPDAIESRRRLGLPPSGRVVLFFGFIRPYKGLDLLLDALAIARRDGRALHALVAGRPLYDISAAMARAGREGLPVTWDLRFIPREEFASYFSAADVVALPYVETFDSGALELAAAFQKPVVVTDAGGLPEAFARYGYGALLPDRSAASLARALTSAYTRPAHRPSENSWPAVAERTAGIYAQAVRG